MAKNNKLIAFLGQNTTFEGTLSFEGTLQIDGDYKGRISAAGNLIVGKTGKVESDIRAASVVISGEVHGNVTADRSIELRIPGKVFGDIQAPVVIIQEGVIFEGNCRTRPVAEEPDPEPVWGEPVMDTDTAVAEPIVVG